MAGLATLPNQRHAEALEAGFDLTLLIVGESGLGKSTLMNALFNAELYESTEYEPAGRRGVSTTTINRSTCFIQEKGTRLRLTIVDTPGYGTAIDNTNCWIPIVNEINKSFEHFVDDEARIHRENIIDNRIHACLYFIAPTGHGLKPLDLTVLSQLHQKVNIIPIIAKADIFTDAECAAMKSLITSQLAEHGIRIFSPIVDEDDDQELKVFQLPFAISCSTNAIKTAAGKAVRGRVYPWGTVETDVATQSEFSRLRDFLLRVHTQELIDQTAQVHYERFRSARLGEITPGRDAGGVGGNVETEDSVLTRIEREKEVQLKKLAKMETEMTQMFAVKVKEKEDRVKQNETQLGAQHENMKQDIAQLQRTLESRKQDLEKEKQAVDIMLQTQYRERSGTTSKSKESKKSTV